MKNNTSSETSLIVDNAAAHPPFIDLPPSIKVVFLSPYSTSLIQSVDQVLIAAFKVYHLRRTFAQPSAATEEDTQTVSFAILEGLRF